MSKALETETVVNALISCKTKQEAADALGISRRTLYNYEQDTDVRNMLDDVRLQQLSGTATYLTASTLAAVEALNGIVADEQQPPQVRISAANTILNQCAHISTCYQKQQDEADSRAFCVFK